MGRGKDRRVFITETIMTETHGISRRIFLRREPRLWLAGPRLLWSDCFLIGHDLTWFQLSLPDILRLEHQDRRNSIVIERLGSPVAGGDSRVFALAEQNLI